MNYENIDLLILWTLLLRSFSPSYFLDYLSIILPHTSSIHLDLTPSIYIPLPLVDLYYYSISSIIIHPFALRRPCRSYSAGYWIDRLTQIVLFCFLLFDKVIGCWFLVKLWRCPIIRWNILLQLSLFWELYVVTSSMISF